MLKKGAENPAKVGGQSPKRKSQTSEMTNSGRDPP